MHVITGKGKGSPGRPVLKTRMKTMLRAGLPQVEEWGPDLDQGGYLIRLKQRRVELPDSPETTRL